MVSRNDERPMREQLIEARAKIAAQLEELHLRTAPCARGNAIPPDFQPVIAELEGELRDIDALLGTAEETDPR